MTTTPNGAPPKKVEAGAPPQDNRTSTNNQTADNSTAQLRRRGNASRRCPVLDSGRSDCWHYPAPGARGYEPAAHHLLELGLTPAPNRVALTAMWRRGGDDRRVAELIARRWGMCA
jgi:hypothetical protein